MLWLGLPSSLLRNENKAFQKRSSKRRNLKSPAFTFHVDGEQLENEALRKRWCHDNLVISLTEFPSNTNPTWPVIVALRSERNPALGQLQKKNKKTRDIDEL